MIPKDLSIDHDIFCQIPVTDYSVGSLSLPLIRMQSVFVGQTMDRSFVDLSRRDRLLMFIFPFFIRSIHSFLARCQTAVKPVLQNSIGSCFVVVLKNFQIEAFAGIYSREIIF